ncbi:hypothetical protein HDU76_012607 [Blyttiomyces sp. JEL0837]|nr:hypothetical protein HDU76_012607 [Blyttiomyces sp. JEL0837]
MPTPAMIASCAAVDDEQLSLQDLFSQWYRRLFPDKQQTVTNAQKLERVSVGFLPKASSPILDHIYEHGRKIAAVGAVEGPKKGYVSGGPADRMQKELKG